MSKANNTTKKSKSVSLKEEKLKIATSSTASYINNEEDLNNEEVSANIEDALRNDIVYQFMENSDKTKKKVVKEEIIPINKEQSKYILDLITRFQSEFKSSIKDPRLATLQKCIEQIKNDLNTNRFNVKKIFTTATRPLKSIFEVYNNIEEASNIIRSIIQNNFNPSIVKCIKKPSKSKSNVYPHLQISSEVTKCSWFDFDYVEVKKKSYFETHCNEIQIYNFFATMLIEISRQLSPDLYNSLSKTFINILKTFIDYSFNDTNKTPPINRSSTLATSHMKAIELDKSKFVRPIISDVASTDTKKTKSKSKSLASPTSPLSSTSTSSVKYSVSDLLPKQSLITKKKISLPINVLDVNENSDKDEEDEEDEENEEEEEDEEEKEEENILNEDTDEDMLKNCSPRKNIISQISDTEEEE